MKNTVATIQQQKENAVRMHIPQEIKPESVQIEQLLYIVIK